MPLAPNPLVPALQPPHPAAHCPSPRLPSLWRKRGRCVCSFPNSESSGCRCSLTSGFTAPPMPSGGGRVLPAALVPAAHGPSWLLRLPLQLQRESSHFLPLLGASRGPQALQLLDNSCLAPLPHLLQSPPPRPSQEATPGVGGTQLPRLSSRACPFIFL